jgi:DNA-binding transcriptional ArsR family regulator
MEPPDFDATLAFLKALANEQRLRIVGLLMDQRRSVQKLAALVGLKGPTIHLAVLNRIGLQEMTRRQPESAWMRA